MLEQGSRENNPKISIEDPVDEHAITDVLTYLTNLL